MIYGKNWNVAPAAYEGPPVGKVVLVKFAERSLPVTAVQKRSGEWQTFGIHGSFDQATFNGEKVEAWIDLGKVITNG